MKKLLSLLLILAMTCAFAACSSQNNDLQGTQQGTQETPGEIYGKWNGSVNLAFSFNQGFASVMGEELMEYLSAKTLFVKTCWEFTEDGKYTMTIDSADYKKALNDLVPQLVGGLKDALRAQGQDVEKNEAEMEETYGMNYEGYIRSLIADTIYTEIPAKEGTYKLDGDKLYLDDIETEHILVKVTATTMQFVSYVGEDAQIFLSMYGGTSFQRQ